MGCGLSCLGDEGSALDPTQLSVFYENAKLTENMCVVNQRAIVRRKHGDVKGVNNYNVVRPLGEGRYGEVYLCESQRQSGRRMPCCRAGHIQKFAVKIVKRVHAMGIEFKILMKVQHRHVVRMLEYIDDRKQCEIFLVFEVLGQPIGICSSMGQLRGTPPWSEDRARPLFAQMVAGLLHLHKVGIVHRDIKPENVVYTDATCTYIKFIDFGESRMLKQGVFGDDSSRLTKGTPFFQAAETLTGFFYPDKSIDVWALGVLFYLLLAGHVPFGCGCTHTIDLYSAIEHQRLGFPQHLMEKPVAALLSAMLNRDLSRRITLPAVGGHAWFGTSGLCHSESMMSITPETSLAVPPAAGGSSSELSETEGTPRAAIERKRPAQIVTNPLCSPGLSMLKTTAYTNTPRIRSDHSLVAGQESEKEHVPEQQVMPAESMESPLGRLLGAQMPSTKVLVVDHIHHNRLILCKMLYTAAVMPHGGSLPIYELCSGESAVESILAQSRAGTRYDLVLMEMHLPDVNALCVAQRVREAESLENLERTPIAIATTEEDCVQEIGRRAEGLTVAVLIKPFNIAQVVRILNWLGVRTRNGLQNEDFARAQHIADRSYISNSMARAKAKRFHYPSASEAILDMSPPVSQGSMSMVSASEMNHHKPLSRTSSSAYMRRQGSPTARDIATELIMSLGRRSSDSRDVSETGALTYRSGAARGSGSCFSPRSSNLLHDADTHTSELSLDSPTDYLSGDHDDDALQQ